jgi:hypothetical protein
MWPTRPHKIGVLFFSSEGYQPMLKTIQTIIGIVKDVVLVVVLIYSFIHARQAFNTVLGQITNQSRYVKSFEADPKGKIKIELEDARKSLQTAVDLQSKTEGKQDQPVAPEAKNIVAAIKQTDDALSAMGLPKNSEAFLDDLPDQKSQTWVYLGIEKNGQWNPNYFQLTGQPKKGQVITASTDVFERNSKPVYVDSIKDWKLGITVGVLSRGGSATILDLDHIEADNNGQNWWAKIK